MRAESIHIATVHPVAQHNVSCHIFVAATAERYAAQNGERHLHKAALSLAVRFCACWLLIGNGHGAAFKLRNFNIVLGHLVLSIYVVDQLPGATDRMK
jgi:hypothetical protein